MYRAKLLIFKIKIYNISTEVISNFDAYILLLNFSKNKLQTGDKT